MMRRMIIIGSCSCALAATTGCVTTGTHQAVLDDLAKTRSELESTRGAREQCDAKGKELDTKLTSALDQNQQLVTKVSAMGQNVEQLLGEKDSLAQERERLTNERKELASEVEELKRMRAAAEARNAEYKSVIEKLRRMIDAGTLQVKVRNGRMLVQMSSDVVFPAGGTRIKAEARDAITQLAETIKQFPDRKFQVVGHSDATPIRSERFPSNWELSSQRAIEVVRLMVEAGVPAEMLSAAGQAEFDPLATSDSDADKAVNRRVEIVFMPKLDELPGFDKALSDKK
jgi:chemotaxis protein MotB